jgi:hypothetical protein
MGVLMIDKIIERLKREKLIAFETLANTGDEKFDFAYLKVGNYADKAIDIVKQATEEGGWIKCSDRLPTSNGRFLVYTDHKTKHKRYSTEIWTYQKETERKWMENKYYGWEVKAWQPLPLPYTENRN